MRRFRPGTAANAETELHARLVRDALAANDGKIKPSARDVGVSVQTFKRWMVALRLREPTPAMVRRGWTA